MPILYWIAGYFFILGLLQAPALAIPAAKQDIQGIRLGMPYEEAKRELLKKSANCSDAPPTEIDSSVGFGCIIGESFIPRFDFLAAPHLPNSPVTEVTYTFTSETGQLNLIAGISAQFGASATCTDVNKKNCLDTNIPDVIAQWKFDDAVLKLASLGPASDLLPRSLQQPMYRLVLSSPSMIVANKAAAAAEAEKRRNAPSPRF